MPLASMRPTQMPIVVVTALCLAVVVATLPWLETAAAQAQAASGPVTSQASEVFTIYGVMIIQDVTLTVSTASPTAGEELTYTRSSSCSTFVPGAITRSFHTWWSYGSGIYFFPEGRGAVPAITSSDTPVAGSPPAPLGGPPPPGAAECDGSTQTSQGAFLVPASYAGRSVRVSVGVPKLAQVVVDQQPVQTDTLGDNTSGSLPLLTVARSTWHRDKAVSYALRWTAVSPGTAHQNPKYPSDGPEDNTSFISEALHEGGLRERSGPAASMAAWWANQPGLLSFFRPHPSASQTWSTAEDLSRYLAGSGEARLVQHWEDVRPGDIVQIDDRNQGGDPVPDGSMDQTLVVTGRDPGHSNPMDDLTFTWHGPDHRGVTASYLRDRIPPDTDFKVWHIL